MCDIWATPGVVTMEMILKKPFLFLLIVQSHKLNDLCVSEGREAFKRDGREYFLVFLPRRMFYLTTLIQVEI